MPRKIEYFFSLSSPWAYLGHEPFIEIARRHGAEVNFKPVLLRDVFGQTGGLPLPKRHPVRQRYRLFELQRWREKRKRDFKLQPRHVPFDPTLADRFAIGIIATGQDPEPFLRRAFRAVWEDELDLTDEAVLTRLATDAGLDATRLPILATGTTTEAVYALNIENAVDAGVFGSPAYVVDGEVFWGQDRLDLLDDMLTSGREAFRAEVEEEQ